MTAWVNPVLDHHLEPGGAAAALVAGHDPQAAPGDDAIGDSQGPNSGGGLMAHAYLHRARHYNHTTPPSGYGGVARDLLVATRTV